MCIIISALVFFAHTIVSPLHQNDQIIALNVIVRISFHYRENVVNKKINYFSLMKHTINFLP